MRPALSLVLAAGICGAPAYAAPSDVRSDKPESVEVTVYRENDIGTEDIEYYQNAGLVMVREKRTIDLPAGASRILFLNVADRILPQSAAIDGLPSATIERNFDYDLMSPGAILEKSIGAPVRLVRTNPRTGAETIVNATVHAAPNGVALDIAGKIEALHCSGLPERLVFDHIPEKLGVKPTLSSLIETPKAGRYTIQLSYLASGLLWSADYVARVAPDGESLTLTAWVTLANQSETTFAGAPTEVIAGKLARVPEDWEEPQTADATSRCWPVRYGRGRVPPPPAPPPMYMTSPMAVADDASEIIVTAAKRRIDSRDLDDVKLYALPEATTIAAHQIKQVQFLDQPEVKAERLYRHILPAGDVDDDDASQQTIRTLRLINDPAHGLGLALPQGKLTAYEKTRDGEYLFTGAGAVRDVPAGSPVDISIGPANDVTVRATREAERATKTGRRISVAVEMTNGNATPANVELAMLQEPGARVTREGKRHRIREGFMTWSFVLAGGKTETFHYTVGVLE